MKLKFSSDQQYQLEAIRSVVEVFRGQPNLGEDLKLGIAVPDGQMNLGGELVVANNLTLDQETIFKNVQGIQRLFNDMYSFVDGSTEKSIGEIDVSQKLESMNFSVEMETGTGKTYVYLRTIHELYREYGFKKFVIVVSSIAIKEGVLKNLQVTEEHFDTLYSHPKIDYYVYDPKKRGQLRNFAKQNTLQVLIINIDSFSKDVIFEENESVGKKGRGRGNIIYQDSDVGVPIRYLQSVSPIVIMDEPQNMETEKRQKAIANLNPLCTLRYSATHKNFYNLLYRLDPVRAYDLGLVKKIEVDSILSEDSYSQAYIKLIEIVRRGGSKILARIEVDESDEGGLQKRILTIEPGDDLHILTRGRDAYQGFVLDKIRSEDKEVLFTNGKTYQIGKRDEALSQEIMKYQIERTVENHFEKERQLKERGIKVLTLFFIDKVSNYRQYTDSGYQKGDFAKWFEDAYARCQEKYKDVLDHPVEAVHNGYFAQDKQGNWKDSKDTKGEGGRTESDDGAYELIMKEKERLLDVKEPLRFIFSHSALREGWDNPNVFQICTLNETKSETRKRQEIGRGLRLPVDSNGERVMDASVNVLTVVANESYEEFAKSLQSEIEDECGVSFGSGRIKDKHKKRILKVRKGFELDTDFQELWKRIRQKTRYHVQFKTEDVIREAAKRLKEVEIRIPKIRSTRARIGIDYTGVSGVVNLSPKAKAIYTEKLRIPDILSAIERETKLTKNTIVQIFIQSERLNDLLINPQQMIDESIKVFSDTLKSLMVDGIKYEKIADSYWEMTRFEDRELQGYVNSLYQVQKKDRTIFDYIPWDSEIEHEFVRDLEARDDIKFYFKLPDWFRISTPLGTYNPDWAIVFEGDERIYFVAETKSAGRELRQSEELKIKCGAAHFKELEGVRFKRVAKLEEIII